MNRRCMMPKKTITRGPQSGRSVASKRRRTKSTVSELLRNAPDGYSVREAFEDSFVPSHLPESLSITSGIALDRFGKSSLPIDIAVLDEREETPLMSPNGQALIPIETLYGAVDIAETLTTKRLTHAVQKCRMLRTLRLHRHGTANAQPPAITYALVAFQSELSLDTVAKRLRDAYRNVNAADQLHLVHVLGQGIVHRGTREGDDIFVSDSSVWRRLPESMRSGPQSARNPLWAWLQLFEHWSNELSTRQVPQMCGSF